MGMGAAVVIPILISVASLIISFKEMYTKDISSAVEDSKKAKQEKEDFKKIWQYLISYSQLGDSDYVQQNKNTWFIRNKIKRTNGYQISTDGKIWTIILYDQHRTTGKWNEIVRVQANSTLMWKKLQGMDKALQDL